MAPDSRELNRSTVLTELLRRRPISRRDIANTTGVSAATVTRTVEQLLADGIVREDREVKTEARGRRAVLLDLVADRAAVVGVDLGASNTRLIVSDFTGRPLVAQSLPTATDLDAAALARWLTGVITALAGPTWPRVTVVGVGIPGAVRSNNGSITNAPNLPQVEDRDFVATLHRRLGRDLLIDNDANYALLGELRFGAARSSSTAAMLTIGTGLGVGLAISGRLLQGRNGIVGEFGQLPVGPLGARLEHMVTGPGILRRAAEAGVSLDDPAELFLPTSDSSRLHLRQLFDQALLIVLTAVAVSCDPDCIVLGGRVGTQVGADTARDRAGMEATLAVSPTIPVSELGEFSGAAGAVAAGLQRSYRDLGAHDHALVDLPAGSALTVARVNAALR
ncbi:MAG: ROK family protein [Propioniciclava sp.]